MATRQTNHQHSTKSQTRPATTPDARENQLISAAVDLASKQLADGSASAQVITHYLKLGSSRERLEQERLSMEVELLEAKKESMASTVRTEALMKNALHAFRSYSGQEPVGDEDYEYD